MVLGGDRYGLFSDGDHTKWEGVGGLRTRSADAYTASVYLSLKVIFSK